MSSKPLIENTDLLIVRSGRGQLLSTQLAALLDPVDPSTFHQYTLPAHAEVELHGHDVDEYWWFTAGRPTVTLWSRPQGSREYHLEPGDLVCLVRGCCHTLHADHELRYYQFISIPRPRARQGHLLPQDL